MAVPSSVEAMDSPCALEVVRSGPLALVQDAGRPGFASMGVSPSGAADRGSYALANRLVGNQTGAAVLELLLGGLVVRACGSVLVAMTGAPAPGAVNGRSVDHGVRVYLRDGDVLELRTPASGLRTYLAVAGGLDVPMVLGSRSTDVLAGLGPAPVVSGDVLAIGRPGDLSGSGSTLTAWFGEGVDVVVGSPSGTSGRVDGRMLLRLLPGPRADWMADADVLRAGEWVVGAASDRVGVRLDGPPFARAPAWEDVELPSEGLVRGAVQLPPDGRPVVFGADHPVTGGYPVVAVLTASASDRLAQARPGVAVRFVCR